MSARLPSSDALRALRPLGVASYLRVQGWRQEADLSGKGSVWLLPAEGDREEADITLPLQPDLGDFALRMSDVVRTLRQVEQRPEREILQDLITTGSDVIRVRAPSRDAECGSLPLEQAVVFVARARDLMLAAACAAVSKRAYFATRKPTKAIEYLGKVWMGQTERGSNVLTILSPVAPALVPEGELPLNRAPSEPYERQVTRTLAEGLAAMAQAAREAATSGGMGAFGQAVGRGVSANLCDAVAGLSAVGPGEGLDIRIAWSRTWPATKSLPSRIVLGADSIPLVEEAARLFKGTVPIEDVGMQGFVNRLACGPRETRGEVTLEGLVDGQLRRATAELGEGVYSQAVQAHVQRQRVACTGDLVKERGGFRLLNPRDFRVLQEEDVV